MLEILIKAAIELSSIKPNTDATKQGNTFPTLSETQNLITQKTRRWAQPRKPKPSPHKNRFSAFAGEFFFTP